MLRLRPYQTEALDAIDTSLETYSRVAVVVPTGMGKTVIFAHLIERSHRAGKRALVLVHREELAEQAKAKVHSVAPHLSVGIVKAERNEIDCDVIVASVQTLARPNRRAPLMDQNIGIVIVDECHHAVARTWVEVLTDFGCFGYTIPRIGLPSLDSPLGTTNWATPCVGFTATLNRTDGKGLADVWETVAYERDILYGIDNGYLTDVRGQQVTVDGLDLATVAKSRGDYQEGQLGEAMESAGAGEVIAQAYLEHASVPEKWADAEGYGELTVRQGVLFAPTVATAYSWRDSLIAYGITAETIEGNTPSEERALIYKRYEAGEIRVLTNAMVLTEGWDAPWAEVAVIARPTQSASLYTQMVGRVLRPWLNKTEALVLDVVGVTGRHKLQSLTNLVHTEVLDGESYAEARIRVEREIANRTNQTLRVPGVIGAQQVELFAQSHSTWLQTKAGTWFIPVKGGVFFLWPALDGDAPGTWRLGYKKQHTKTYAVERENGWIFDGMTLEYAMAFGEQLAAEDDPTVSLKDRSWRRTKPSQAQIDYAIKLKAVDPEAAYELRKGSLSDLISVAVASRMLDR
jgi:superfamily II DNA or RNA helicase